MESKDHLSDEDIKKYIQNYEESIHCLTEAIGRLKLEYEFLEDNLFNLNSIPSSGFMEGMGSGKNYGDHIINQIIRKEDDLKEYGYAILEQINDIRGEINYIQRVYAAYMALPYEEFLVANLRLEKDIPWRKIGDYMPPDVRIATTKGLAIMQSAFLHIRSVVDSDLSLSQIMKLRQNNIIRNYPCLSRFCS